MFCHSDHKMQRSQQNTTPLTLIDVSYLMRPQSASRLSLYLWSLLRAVVCCRPAASRLSVDINIKQENINLVSAETKNL